MFKLAESPNRFDVYYNNILCFSHRNDDPSLILASGDGEVKFKGNKISLKDPTSTNYVFNKFKVSKYTESNIEITFIGETLSHKANIQFSFTKSLEIKISTDLRFINRCWMRFPAYIQENVYGCTSLYHFCFNKSKIPFNFHDLETESNHLQYSNPTFIGTNDQLSYFCVIETNAEGYIHFHKKGINTLVHEIFFSDIPEKINIGFFQNLIECVTNLTKLYGKACSGLEFHPISLIPSPTNDFLKRWIDQSAFTPEMEIPSHDIVEPDHLSRMTKIHDILNPYISQVKEKSDKSKIPIMRVPILHYPHDSNLYEVGDQYLLGEDLWIIPAPKANLTKIKYYLPEEGWVHLWSGKIMKKGKGKIEIQYGFPAVFYKAESEFFNLFETIRIQFK